MFHGILPPPNISGIYKEFPEPLWVSQSLVVKQSAPCVTTSGVKRLSVFSFTSFRNMSTRRIQWYMTYETPKTNGFLNLKIIPLKETSSSIHLHKTSLIQLFILDPIGFLETPPNFCLRLFFIDSLHGREKNSIHLSLPQPAESVPQTNRSWGFHQRHNVAHGYFPPAFSLALLWLVLCLGNKGRWYGYKL